MYFFVWYAVVLRLNGVLDEMSGGGGKRGPRRDYAAEARYAEQKAELDRQASELEREREARKKAREGARGSSGAGGTLGEGGWKGRDGGLLGGK